MEKRKLSDEHRKKLSEIKKRLYLEGKIKVPNNLGRTHSQEIRNKLSRIAKGKKRSLEIRNNIRLSKLGDKNPLFGKKLSEEHKLKIKLNNSHYWKGKKLSEETRKKISEIQKGKFLGEKNPAWIDGRSYKPYTKEFNNYFKQKIKERDNFICLKCNLHEEDVKKIYKNIGLHIHHIDYNKNLTIKENCCCLCPRCNSEVNQNRIHWIKFFQSLLSEKYEYKYSQNNEIILNFERGCKK